MADWKHLVRVHLNLPPLHNQRAERIVEEIAGQLDDLYEEARRHGASPAEAERVAFGFGGGGSGACSRGVWRLPTGRNQLPRWRKAESSTIRGRMARQPGGSEVQSSSCTSRSCSRVGLSRGPRMLQRNDI
jgi:hypothetical protein